MLVAVKCDISIRTRRSTITVARTLITIGVSNAEPVAVGNNRMLTTSVAVWRCVHWARFLIKCGGAALKPGHKLGSTCARRPLTAGVDGVDGVRMMVMWHS